MTSFLQSQRMSASGTLKASAVQKHFVEDLRVNLGLDTESNEGLVPSLPRGMNSEPYLISLNCSVG